MWQWLVTNGNALSAIIPIALIVWATIQFILAKRNKAKRALFKNYHSLIKQLVQPEKQSTGMYLDRQIAVIYELREYKHYYPVTLRILDHLKQIWSSSEFNSNSGLNPLLHEIDLTIKHISSK